MSQNDPLAPGQVPPPQPPYQVTSDIPPDSPHHYSPAPTSRNRGLLSGIGAALLAAWGFLKYGLLFAFKIPAFGTLVSLVVSFGGYAIFYGPWFAVALVTMIFVHEMGHVLEIRRQGMEATAPIFIPFMGAAIFQRTHPTDALKQAEIGIAGPIAGTIGATAAFALYGATHSEVLLLAALIGFYINLFNLIPVWQLDGAWILAPVSKWFQVAGYAIIGVGALFFHFLLSPLIIIIALLGIPSLIRRFREASNPYYTSVPSGARWAMGGAWLALVIYLGVASLQASTLLGTFAR
ncbi:MAG TPA: site-2 protease family protein [Candidatus Eisenbacteria bacterium]|nr:site-2 protease family protein [Candidatus Eisenbacteria bacterium]